VHVSRLELVDFRSYPRAEVDFEPGVSVLVGPNGVGKTNLVEALGFIATLTSHRVALDAPLVRAGAGRRPGRSWSSWPSSRAGPTGRDWEAPPPGDPGTSWARCAWCCSHPKT